MTVGVFPFSDVVIPGPLVAPRGSMCLDRGEGCTQQASARPRPSRRRERPGRGPGPCLWLQPWVQTSQPVAAAPLTQDGNVPKRVYFFMRHTEREAETQAAGEAGSMQGAPCGTLFLVSRIRPWAEGGAKPLSHPGCPKINILKNEIST